MSVCVLIKVFSVSLDCTIIVGKKQNCLCQNFLCQSCNLQLATGISLQNCSLIMERWGDL